MGNQASSAASSGAPLIQPLLASQAGSLWTMRGKQKFFGGMMEIGGFGVIARLPHSTSLAVINPIELTDSLLTEVNDLQEETKSRIQVLVSPGDWHHLHIMKWVETFPAAKVYVASDRVLQKQPALSTKGAIVMNRLCPEVPELSESFDIIPFLGCQQPPWILGGDRSGTDRVEHVLFHKQTRTLFITDHLFAPSASKTDPMHSWTYPMKLMCNTGGFRIKNANEAADSAMRVLDKRPKNVVFSHGTVSTFAISDIDIRERLEPTYNHEEDHEETTVHTLLSKAYSYHFLKGRQSESSQRKEG